MQRMLVLGREPIVRDRLLAVVLTVIGQVETWTSRHGFSGPRPVIALAVLATTAALLWRRRSPLASSLAIAALVLASSAAWNVPDTIVAPGVALMCSGFALGAHASQRSSIVGLAAFVAALLAASVAERKGLGDFFFLATLYAVLWGAGTVVRSRSALAAQLADRAAVLEHERDEQAVLAAAAERARIARELHDVVAHCVNVMVLQAGAERRLIAGDQPQTAEVLRAIEDTGRQALGELRRLLGLVRAPDAAPLAPQPTLADLPALAQRANASGIQAATRIAGDRCALPPGIELSAYRIVQEALTNTIKHAPGAKATVEITYRPDTLDIHVTNTKPLTAPAPDAAGAGAGLIGMRERVALFAGTFDAGSVRDGGFSVRVRIPIDHPHEPEKRTTQACG